MLLLRKGADGPKVVAIKVLLNHFTQGVDIAVDGVFGGQTRAAVMQFQKRTNPPLKIDGVFGPASWAAMRRLSGNMIVNVIDSGDVEGSEDAIRRTVFAGSSPFDYWQNTVIVTKPGETVTCVVQRIIGRAKPGSIALLRFLGHGHAGAQAVAAGKNDPKLGNALVNAKAWDARYRHLLFRIGTYMCPYGSAELHGCLTGRGAVGTQLLQQLASLWGVPVSAGTWFQYDAGSNRAVFNFEGNVKTVYPGGLCMDTWAKKHALKGFKALNAV